MCHTDCIVLSRITRHLSLLLHFFFFNDTATTEIYTLSLHDALPISQPVRKNHLHRPGRRLYGSLADRRDGNQARTRLIVYDALLTRTNRQALQTQTPIRNPTHNRPTHHRLLLPRRQRRNSSRPRTLRKRQVPRRRNPRSSCRWQDQENSRPRTRQWKLARLRRQRRRDPLFLLQPSEGCFSLKPRIHKRGGLDGLQRVHQSTARNPDSQRAQSKSHPRPQAPAATQGWHDRGDVSPTTAARRVPSNTEKDRT